MLDSHFLPSLGGLRKSSAVLNLILSVQLTARGDSVRGFISALDLSLKAKGKMEKVFGSSHSERNSFFFFFFPAVCKKKHQFLFEFSFTVFGLRLQKRNGTHRLHATLEQPKCVHAHGCAQSTTGTQMVCFFFLRSLLYPCVHQIR